MTNAIQSPTSKKARFLILKQKDVASGQTYKIDFPKSYTELFEIARTKFKGKTIVRTLYSEDNLVVTSIESLKSGSTIYVTSKASNQNSPTINTTNKSTRGLSVQVTSKSDNLSKTIPTKHAQKSRERAKTLTTNTPSPKIKSKTLTVTSASKSEKKSVIYSKESPNVSIKDKNMNTAKRKTATTTKSTSSANPSPSQTPSSPNKTLSKNTPKSPSSTEKVRFESPSDIIPESPLIPKKETPTNQMSMPQSNSSGKSNPNTDSAQKTTPSSQIKTSPNRKPRASSLSRPRANQVESPTNQIPVPVLANEEPISKKISLSPPTNLPKPSPSPVVQQINFTDSNDDQDSQNSPKQSPIPSVQIQIQDDQNSNLQPKLNNKRNTRSSTYFQLDHINKMNSQDILQTTSKTYHRLKNNIIQDDSPATRAEIIQQPRSSSSVPHVHSKSSASMDCAEIPKNLSLGVINNEKDTKPEKPNNEDADAKLFSQIHLRDKKGRRSNTLFTKKSIESAIDVLTYFSPRNAMLKPKQANIQSDGDDDDENVYKASQVKNDKAQVPNKNGEEKEAEKDTLDAFRDSDGSDLFSSSDGSGFIIPSQSKAPILSLTSPTNNNNKSNSPTNSNNNNVNSNSENKSNAISIVPVRYEAPPAMSSPAKLDEFMESDDDMFMFGSDSGDANGGKLKINMNKDNSEYSEYDEYDEYDEYEIELNNFNEKSPSKFVVNPRQTGLKSNSLNINKKTEIIGAVSPSVSGQIAEIDDKNTLNYAKNAINHHRSQSRSSYSFQNQTKLDITAIIDGSLQSPISIPVESTVDEQLSLDLLPRNRSNSFAIDTSSTSSSKNKVSPRIPKRPDVIQLHTNSNNTSSASNNTNNSIFVGSNINAPNNLKNARNRYSSAAGPIISTNRNRMKENRIERMSISSDSSRTRYQSTASAKTVNVILNNSGSSTSVSGNRSRTNSLSRRSRSGSRGSTSSHYERIILSLLDSISSGQSVETEEEIVFSLIDRAVGRYPQEQLGLPTDITASKILPIMENQQGTAWIATGCLLASLQSIPEVETSIFCYNDMVELSRFLISKHIFYSESHLVNKTGSIMGSNVRFNIGIIGPRNSGKSTLLRVLTEELLSQLFLSESWRNTFVFIINMENLLTESTRKSTTTATTAATATNSNFLELEVRSLYLTVVNSTIQHLLWHIPQLLGITKQLTRYFESVVSMNRKHLRHFPRTLTSYNPEIAQELQNIASILSTVWNMNDGFEDFVNIVLLFPKMIAKSFKFRKTFFIIDHYDICHRFIQPSSSSISLTSNFKNSKGMWLTDAMNRAFIENTDFILATKDDRHFFEGPFIQRNSIEIFSTTEIVKKPLSKINGNILDMVFYVEVEGGCGGGDDNEPVVLAFDACGGNPRFMHLWNVMNMAADDIIDFKQEENNESLVKAAEMFIENLFVDENGNRKQYKILSVKRMKKKQKK